MPKAIWNDVVIAESNNTVMVEGNHYFPPNSVNKEFFKKNSQTTVCPWKGTASYYDIEVDGEVNKGAAWYYPDPSKAASNIKDHVAFYGSVKIVKSEGEPGGIIDRIKSLFS